MWRQFAILLIAGSLTASAAAQDVLDITGAELVAKHRQLRERIVRVDDCVLAGVTTYFIRCETPNNEGPSYALDVVGMAPADLKWVIENCPTGSVTKAECRQVRIMGEVANRNSPQLLRARLERPARP